VEVFDWLFDGLDHAAASIEVEGAILPCPDLLSPARPTRPLLGCRGRSDDT
jgi:hypothetical protein